VQSVTYRDRLASLVESATRSHQRASVDDVLKFFWAFPSQAEQHHIVSFLDLETAKIDALIAEQERLIALLQEKRQAVISHAVTKGLNPNVPMKDSGLEWIGAMPAHWTLPPVADRYFVELGKMLDEKRITGTHLTPYLRNVNVQWDDVRTDELPEMDIAPHEAERYLVCEGWRDWTRGHLGWTHHTLRLSEGIASPESAAQHRGPSVYALHLATRRLNGRLHSERQPEHNSAPDCSAASALSFPHSAGWGAAGHRDVS
jgi:hypothetical protein